MEREQGNLGGSQIEVIPISHAGCSQSFCTEPPLVSSAKGGLGLVGNTVGPPLGDRGSALGGGPLGPSEGCGRDRHVISGTQQVRDRESQVAGSSSGKGVAESGGGAVKWRGSEICQSRKSHAGFSQSFPTELPFCFLRQRRTQFRLWGNKVWVVGVGPSLDHSTVAQENVMWFQNAVTIKSHDEFFVTSDWSDAPVSKGGLTLFPNLGGAPLTEGNKGDLVGTG